MLSESIKRGLACALKATHKDKARPTHCVRLEPVDSETIDIVGTNGHWLSVWRAQGEHTLAEGVSLPPPVVKRLVTVLPEGGCVVHEGRITHADGVDTWTPVPGGFPPYREILACKWATPVAEMHFDALYMADILAAIKVATKGRVTKDRHPIMTFRHGGALDPIRIGVLQAPELTILLMPVLQ